MAVYTSIDNPELYFQVKTYSGTGSSNAITLDGDEDMQPSMIWIKNRADNVDQRIFDSVRGASKSLIPNNTDAEYNDTSTVMLSSFNSDGFTVVSHSNVHDSSDSHVAWCWKETADAGFDILTYTGNETARTISHSLSAKPRVIICKGVTLSSNWTTQHGSYGAEKQFQLQETDAVADNATTWNDTEPTTSVFSVGTSTACNDNGETFIAYLFAEKQGYSKFGKFTGNGNDNGPFVYTGFRPAWVLTKKASETSEWHIYDNKRETYNVRQNVLSPNGNYADSINANCNTDFLSNGFKIRNNNDNRNDSGETHIYMAFAEAPFVNSKGVPCNAG